VTIQTGPGQATNDLLRKSPLPLAQCGNRDKGCRGQGERNVVMLVRLSGKTEERGLLSSGSKQQVLRVKNLPYSAILRGLCPSREETVEG